MAHLTIVADIRVKPDQGAAVKAQLVGVIEPTRAESGCVQYDLHQDNNDASHFLFFENWESREQWQNHMQAGHLLAYKKATEGMIDSVAIYEMEKVET